jgi:hypothetical protein
LFCHFFWSAFQCALLALALLLQRILLLSVVDRLILGYLGKIGDLFLARLHFHRFYHFCFVLKGVSTCIGQVNDLVSKREHQGLRLFLLRYQALCWIVDEMLRAKFFI